MTPLTVCRTRVELTGALAPWRRAGDTIGLVPTMGALHDGHLSLVRRARARCGRVVASLFVNPTQFAPEEDFAAYPRNETRDATLLAGAGCDLLYAPGPEEIYPPGHATTVTVAGASEGMEGAMRPHHFAGVATVVTKLLVQCRPDVAVFGEKDFQQLVVVRILARDLELGCEIVGAPIVRAADGLALSSRNAYLTPLQRRIAPALGGALAKAALSLARGEAVSAVESEGRRAILKAGFEAVDYFEARAPETLARLGPGPLAGPARLLAAARLGRTRLLDNVPA